MGWVLWALGGCAPGWLEGASGRENALTALYVTRPAGDGVEAVLLVANTALECALLPESEDPVELALAQNRIASALTREGARTAALRLYRYTAAAPTWEGLYPLSEEAGHALNTAERPLNAGAMWYAVGEATLEDEDGLYRTYSPVELTYLDPVPAPGWVRIDRAEPDTLHGQFALDAAHTGGGFRATDCGDELTLFEYLNLVALEGP